MSTLDLPVHPARPPTPVARAPADSARAHLKRLPVPPEATAGTPYYDDEFDMAQSKAHAATVRYLGDVLERIAGWAGLEVLSDNPVRYWIPATSETPLLYPDYALAAPVDAERTLATDLRLALEIVSTERAAKERKDTERMRALNAANGVPEFALLYPELDDPRALRWFVLDPGAEVYREVPMPAERRLRSRAVPGLEWEVLEPAQWTPGRKVRLWYRGERVPSAEESRREAEAERRARAAAEAENARLLALLRQAGLSAD